MQAAETLALVYSFDGEDTSSSGELALLADLAGIEVAKLYGFVAELKSRSVIQSRGRWRALLPHAIANRLAAQAFERIPLDRMDSFCASLPLRLKKSFSRRLGYLHDNDQSRRAVERWLQPDGPLGDLLEADDDAAHILRNIAPVSPEAVLRRIESEIDGPNSAILLHPRTSHRWQLTMILKSLAYAPELFDRATKALARFVAAETPDENHNSARGAFQELFHLHLSGTLAPPDQRRALIQSFYEQGGEGIRTGNLALDALLESGHFSSSSNFDFGARPRDFGWHPPTYGDIWNWYKDGVALATSLGAEPSRRAEIKKIVSGNLRGILGIKSCLEAVEGAVEAFLNDGEWIEGWLAIRGSLRFDGDGWQATVKERVEALEAKLRPTDPLNIARAYVMEGRSGFDLLDGDRSEEQDLSGALNRLADKAEAIGRDFGAETDLLQQFLPEVLSVNHAPRAFAFGMGLAASEMPNVEMWAILRTALLALPLDKRNASVLGGFIRTANAANPGFGSAILDEMSFDPEMAPHFVYLQAIAGIDEEAVARLRRAIASGHIEARYFYSLVSGAAASVSQSLVGSMLSELSASNGGIETALEILHMTVYSLRQDGTPIERPLLDLGHQLLLRMDYSDSHQAREYRVRQTIEDCYAGPAGEHGARELCQHIKRLISDKIIYAFSIDHVFEALFETQPLVALDEFLLGDESDDNDDPIYGGVIFHRSPLDKVESTVLWSWADQEPKLRYPLVSRSISVFATDQLSDDTGLSPQFLEGVDRAPDRAEFLNSLRARMHPSGWSGNLSAVLDRRADLLQQLASRPDQAVQAWTVEQTASLKKWANRERERETEREEAFE